jgi:hypothetical protein
MKYIHIFFVPSTFPKQSLLFDLPSSCNLYRISLFSETISSIEELIFLPETISVGAHSLFQEKYIAFLR